MEPDGGIPLSLVLADAARPCSSEGYRRLAYVMLDGDVVAVSPSSVYRVLKSAGKLAARWGKPFKRGSVRLTRQKCQETQRETKAWQAKESQTPSHEHEPFRAGPPLALESGAPWLIGNIDLKLMPARSTPERIVIGKRRVGVPLPELEKWKPSPAVDGEG